MKQMRVRHDCVIAMSLTFLVAAQLHVAKTKTCNDGHPRNYRAQPSDLSTPANLNIRRSMKDLHVLHIDICTGDLRIFRSPIDDDFRLQVTSSRATKPLGSFLQTFTIENHEAFIRLQLPAEAHAVITLYVPNEVSESEVELGAGSLRLKGSALRGDRKLNIGSGTAYLELNGRHDYSEIQASIGMGYLLDKRPGGHNGFLVVNRELYGVGEGVIEMHVGAGSINLLPAE